MYQVAEYDVDKHCYVPVTDPMTWQEAIAERAKLKARDKKYVARTILSTIDAE